MSYVTLQKGHISAKIALQGAELHSLYDHKKQEEFIWQREANIWGGSAPVCFPIVCALKNDEYTHDGQKYHMPKHGVVRYEEFTVIEQGDEYCILSTSSNERTYAHYPFDFELQLEFSLRDDGLKVTYRVINKNGRDMPFSLGYHPAFNIDLENYSFEDYVVKFSERETLDLWAVDDDYHLYKKQENYLNSQDEITITADVFHQDALMFQNIKSDAISILNKKSGWSLKMLTGGAPDLGIWSKPAAPYICIEPWYNCPDTAEGTESLFDKRGVMRLGAKEVFESWYRVIVES